jgi:TPP-dependent pyruvate/acetoin dehydrogenase alpha subunit
MHHDPILRFAKALKEQHNVAEAELEAMDQDVLAQVADAVRFADQSAWPAPETLYEDVYVRSPYIHARSADRDPAWRAAVKEDRIPERLPERAPLPAPAKVEG